MTQYFVESKSKPQLFCFSQDLGHNFDDIAFINTFQENFDQIEKENWITYWNAEGEDLILNAWNEKYKDYLKDSVDIEKRNETHTGVKQESTETLKADILNTNERQTEDLGAKDISEGVHKPDYETQLYTWDDLWEQHREEIYAEQYLIFTTIFYNYFLDIKNSMEEALPKVEDTEEEEVTFLKEHLQLTEELEQLKILGLPTSFGNRTQSAGKKSKKHHSKNLHFSDFFSESEIEDDSSGSEIMEEYSLLHKIENNAVTKKTKKKNRKLKNVPSYILEEKGLLKYWRKRFSLFSRFDEGIRLDRESWFSVTPEKVAMHLAERLKCCILVDGFCGSGGNAIQFAKTCNKVIAIDIDPIKLEMAKHNAKIYNVAHKIEFITGDFLQIASSGKLKADIVFLSPPWGGPKYKNKKDYDIEKYLLPVNATDLLAVSRHVSDNEALFLPRNSNVKQIVRLAGVGKRCEIEHNYLDSRLVALTALYGEEILKKNSNIT